MTHRGIPHASAPAAATVEDPGALLDRLERTLRGGARFLGAADAAALDALAVSLARGGAHELAIGEGLDQLSRTGGDIRLGFSGVGDLARERLGLPADQARRLRRDAAKLRSRPLLRAAVLRGDVSLRKAEVVLSVAVGPAEAYWVARAAGDTVRRLQAAVRREPDHAETDWHALRIGLPPGHAEVVEVALQMAGILLGPTAPAWRRIGAIAMEFLSSHPVDPLEPFAARPPPVPPAGWGAPPEPPDVARGVPPVGPVAEDPYLVVARLERLVRERAAEDELLGRACLLLRRSGAFRWFGFASFDAYCEERLGLARSTVRQRIALERRLQALPELREALRSGRLSYEQARLVARVARPGDVAERIAAAASKTCIAYRRELEGEEDRQMWRAGELRAVVPDEVDGLVADAILAARVRSGGGFTPGEALVAVALHFIGTWKEEVRRIVKATDEVVLRDGGLCTVPGCSRAADHVHHVRYRSAGGPLEPWNETCSCDIHHLRGVHDGNVLIEGRAPDGLRFTLGEREVRAARGRGPSGGYGA
jgi:hypothetical protein